MQTFGFVHLSAGDLLREERQKPGSEYGELIEKHIRDGTIVPVEITCSLIENVGKFKKICHLIAMGNIQYSLLYFIQAMKESDKNNFLIDGFPRNQNNLDGWTTQMGGKVHVHFVLFLEAPEDVCVNRCLQRGQAGSGRSDDNPESLKKRVVTYNEATMPIVNHFEGLSLVKKVDASKGPEEVFEQVKIHFKAFPQVQS